MRRQVWRKVDRMERNDSEMPESTFATQEGLGPAAWNRQVPMGENLAKSAQKTSLGCYHNRHSLVQSKASPIRGDHRLAAGFAGFA
jgi:hypothetical protein